MEQWRRATIVVTVVAAVELVGIVGLGVALLGNPLANRLKEQAAAAAAPRVRTGITALPTKTTLTRAETSVIVLNGNGRPGAAAAAADAVRRKGYLIGSVGNAPTHATRTLVMYRPGYAVEARRLARDAGIGIVSALDGMKTSSLHRAQLVILLGAS
jgi:hypothetical protein